MQLGEMTMADRDANAAAVYYPSAEEAVNEGVYAAPCIEIDSAQVYAYVQDGVLVVSVDLEGAGDAFDHYGDQLVPLVMRVGGETVFELTNTVRSPEHEETIDVLARAARPRRNLRNLWGLLG